MQQRKLLNQPLACAMAINVLHAFNDWRINSIFFFSVWLRDDVWRRSSYCFFIWTANHVDGCYSEMHSLNMFIERENVLYQLVGIQTDWKWRQASKEIGENFHINVTCVWLMRNSLDLDVDFVWNWLNCRHRWHAKQNSIKVNLLI